MAGNGVDDLLHWFALGVLGPFEFESQIGRKGPEAVKVRLLD